MARSTVSTSARWPASGNGPRRTASSTSGRRRPRASPGRRAGARGPRAGRPCACPARSRRAAGRRMVGLGEARAVAPAQLDVALQVGREGARSRCSRAPAARPRAPPPRRAPSRRRARRGRGGPCRSRAGRRARRRPRSRRAAPRVSSSSPTRSSVKRSWARRPTVARSSPRASAPAGGMITSWSQASSMLTRSRSAISARRSRSSSIGRGYALGVRSARRCGPRGRRSGCAAHRPRRARRAAWGARRRRGSHRPSRRRRASSAISSRSAAVAFSSSARRCSIHPWCVGTPAEILEAYATSGAPPDRPAGALDLPARDRAPRGGTHRDRLHRRGGGDAHRRRPAPARRGGRRSRGRSARPAGQAAGAGLRGRLAARGRRPRGPDGRAVASPSCASLRP